MQWLNQLGQRVSADQLQIINDSKTPSGRVHVGALRGVLIHDAAFRFLKERGVPVKYLFGVDDYDPLDELPKGREEFFQPYLGAPLCNVPPPEGSSAPDMAEHYIGEFFQIFTELGVVAETYRMRDIYRSGRFNEPIDTILRNGDKVRKVYREVSGSIRPDDWYPFQVICEQCGRIGTTQVTEYDGREVTYVCRPDLVKWATGCGQQGKVSPFDGNGKLPWKLEWVAKWHVFPVTVEGAGKDHSTKGGSRDVSAGCLKEIWGERPPYNIPYEFFLVEGAKMSSSKGIGAAAREIADLLPPELLRYLMLGTWPSRPVNFSTGEEYFVKSFNEWDRLHQRTFQDPKAKEDDRLLFRLTETAPEGPYFDVPFQLVLTLIQMPHVDLVGEVELRKGSPLTELERAKLERRIQTARLWLDRYAEDEEKLTLQESLPVRAAELSASQRGLLHGLAASLETAPWEEEALQTLIFDTARLTPVDGPTAFQAIYRVLFDRASGPKAGNVLAYLDREMVVRRFREVPLDLAGFWRETGISVEDLEAFFVKEQAKLATIQVTEVSTEPPVTEVTVTMADGRAHGRRVLAAKAAVEAVAERFYAEMTNAAGE